MPLIALLLWLALPVSGPTTRTAGAPMPVKDVTPPTRDAESDSRTRVTNVTYAPLASASGKPIGVRVTYQVEFSASGRYNPALRMFPVDPDDPLIGRNPMHALDSRVEPLPREVQAPHVQARYIQGLLDQRADFLYEAGTVYTFTVDLVPNYLALEGDLFTPCVFRDRFERNRSGREAFARRLASDSTTEYRASIGGAAFDGRIEFEAEGTLYRNFVSDGGRNCEELPVSRR